MSTRVVPRRLAGPALGMTLLEMLIVLVVIAVVSGATVLTLTPRQGNSTESAARVVAARLQLAADRALVSGGSGPLVIDRDGFQTPDEARHLLPAGTRFTGLPTGSLQVDLVRARPFELRIASNYDRWRVAFDGLRAVATADPGGS